MSDDSTFCFFQIVKTFKIEKNKQFRTKLCKTCEMNSQVISFHVYKEISIPSIGDTIARRQPEHPKDRFWVFVMIDDQDVGHRPSGKSRRFF